MYTIIFLQGFVFYGPVATLFRQARGLSMSQIFVIESISWALIILLEVPWGWISDKFGYKKTLIVVNTLFFISKIVFFTAHSLTSFLIERILVSIVTSGLSGCDTALIYGSIKESDTQKVFGRYSAFGTLGFFIACILSTFIIRVSLDYTALLTIFPYGASVILTLFLTEVKAETEEKTSVFGHFKSAFSNTSAIPFVLSIALITEVVHSITVFLNQSQYVKSGIDPKYFGLILAGIQSVGLLSTKANVISKKLGNTKTIYLLVTLILGSCFLLILTRNPLLSVLGILLIALSMALIGPIDMDIRNQFIRSSDRATVLSIYSMTGGLLASLSNILIGKAADQSLERALMLCAFLIVLSFILLVLYSHMHKGSVKNDVSR